jgi:alanyl-tRNA synthetase
MTQLTLEELLAALAKLPEGSKFAEALKAIIAAKESELTQKGTQYKTLTKTLKETEEKLKKAAERLEKFHDHTGVADDVEAALTEIKSKEEEALKAAGGKGAPEIAQLQRDIAKLQRDLKKATDAQTASETIAKEERSKRQTSERNRALLSALTEHKAVKPDQLLKILADKVKVNDDETLAFLKDDGEEVEVNAGVKGWLDVNPEFVTNNQYNGAGSGGGGGTGGKSSFAAALLKSNQPTERLQQAENHYFGGAGK